MPADSELWLPPLSPKAQKKANRRRKYQGLVKWTGFPEKTLWDWLQLLAVLAIPVVIAAGTLWFTAQQGEASSQASEKQHQTDLQVAKDQHQTDIQIAQDQQQENALQTYLDHMSDLLLNNKLRESQPVDEVRNVARARTLTVLPQLNGTRKGEIVRFLNEAGLISQEKLIVSLNGANFSGADLSSATLRGVDLSGTNLGNTDLSGTNLGDANLRGVDLSSATLRNTDLSGTNLGDANLSGTNLNNADLSNASLSNASLSNADLSNASLSNADLRNADLNGANLTSANLGSAYLNNATFFRATLTYANLSHADLSHADLSSAYLIGDNITQEQLKQVKSLKGAVMPDGSIHP